MDFGRDGLWGAFGEGAWRAANGQRCSIADGRNPDLYRGTGAQLRGERPEDWRVRGREWDAPSTSGYTRGPLAAIASLLAEAVWRITFLSTISVYDDGSAGRHADEMEP